MKDQHHGASKARQFAAVLQKNLILQIRGRRSFLGLGGWAALALQILLPALFFTLMCIPKYYIQPYEHPVYLQQNENDIDTRWWAGASPYEGPALAAGGNARIAFVPDTPEVSSLIRRLAMAVSCPSEAYKRICSTASITTFACMFGVQQAPAECQNATTCMMTPGCYQAALQDHLLLLHDEAAVQALLQEQPHSLDAVVVFPHAVAAAAAAQAAAADMHHASTSRPAAGGINAVSTRRSLSTQGETGSPQPKQLVGCGAPAPPDGDGLLLDYVIRMNSSDVPPTQLLQDLFDVSPGVMPLPGNLLWEYRKYWFFVNLQVSIDRALLGGQQSPGAYPAPLTIKIKPFPWPARQEDLGAASAAAFFNLLLVYAFMAPTRAVVGSIVREKELRLREGMRILGLSEAAYWWSWSVTHWLTLAASGLLCGLVGLYPFRHSSFALMLAFYWLFSAALISFSYFLSTLFSASRVAGTATQFIYALSMIPGFLLPFVRPYGGISWFLAGLSPTSAASLFAAALVNWERLAAGVTLDTLWLPVAADSGFCVGSVFWLLAVDVVMFAALTWYCDKVVPQPHGQTLPPWFPLMPSYWRAGSDAGADNTGSRQRQRLSADTSNDAEQREPLLLSAGGEQPGRGSTRRNRGGSRLGGGAAPAPAAGAAGEGRCDDDACMPQDADAAYVSLRDLRKVFHSSEGSVRVAVEGLSLDMWAGRVTALLGHNGAGKTTTIHMLTGMLQPTSGTAFIGGHDIRTSMGIIRQSLGICPQFDILWPDITVAEHLQLYAVIKGATWADASTQVQHAAAEVGLSDKLSCLAAELSGGQRRKLSVAIAFLGSPAVVFLDEPTSGMDPYSRRTTWDVIRRRRLKSVIVLTTHSMEEADLLCDDIHIMAEGRLVASGSPLSLKARYGVGYTLTVVLTQPKQLHNGAAALQHGVGGGSSNSLCSSSSTGSLIQQAAKAAQSQAADGLMRLVQQHIPSAQLLSAAGSEVSLRLPKEEAAAFPAALRALDAASDQLGVSSYGLSVTTLEEVFLAVADQAVAMGPPGHSNQTAQPHMRAEQPTPATNGAGQHPAAKLSSSSRPGSSSTLEGAAGGAAKASSTAAEEAAVQQDCEAPARTHVLSGVALYWQQFRALFVKRALCARRDRLAVITQLLVPLLLVVLAMAVSTVETQRVQQPPLQVSRATCLMDKTALLAAAPGLRQQQEVQGFMDGFPRGDLQETFYTHLYHGSSGPALNLTLEGQLLSQWSSGSPHYDALFLQAMPPVDQLLTGLAGSGPSLTVLVNQSAVSGLPASLNQVSSALLRLMVAAGGAKSSPRPASTTVRAASAPAVSSPGAAPDTTTTRPEDVALHSSTGSSSSSSSSLSGGAPRRLGVQDQASLSSKPAGGHSSHRDDAATAAAAAAATGTAAGGVLDVEADAGSNGSSDSHSGTGGGGHLPSCMPEIHAVSSPLPLMDGEKAQRVRQDAGALMLVLCMTLAASVLSASFVVFLVRETDNNSKHLQLVSGAHPTAYWLANFCWDMINYCVPAAGIVLLVYWYHQPQLSGIRLGAMALLLLAFGGAGLNLTYLCHYLFVDEMKALQRLNTAYFLTGYLGFLTTWVLGLIAMIMSRPSLGRVADRTKAVLRLVSPHYCFAQGLYDISNTAQGSGALPIPGLPHGPSSPFTYSVLGSAVVHLVAQTLVFGAATVLIDVGIMQLLRKAWAQLPWRSKGHKGRVTGNNSPSVQRDTPDSSAAAHTAAAKQSSTAALEQAENGAAGAGAVLGAAAVVDADVAAEQQAVEAGDGLDQAMVVVDGIRKEYSQGPGEPPVIAVSGLWLRVWPGECFGLLGVNGAGKTSTFKVLTGEVTPDAGDAQVSHFSVLTQLADARQRLGYCPQFEALPAAMTGREVLTMYARLRGASGAARIAAEVQQLLQQLGLVQYADVACGSYSGGNKRKLSVAVALVGNPPLVLLDEPSTGMDPAARRFLWRVLQDQVLSAGRTIILTSHSMEEVDALASRLIIMAAGSARCLGTPQHLKSKFGDGYTLELRIGANSLTPAATAAAAAAPNAAAHEPAEAAVLQPDNAEQGASTAEVLAAATDRAEQYFESVMPGTASLEKEPGRLLLRLPLGDSSGAHAVQATQQQRQQVHDQVASLSDVFEAVEAVRESLGINEYSLAQSTLERVFLSLARAASHA